ncbi:MAG TPA: ATP-binding protein [Candidatus Krumholzibacteria bacterium]|nr:ATP-binding protein [Candidatus Krumholzibacteria bacterium]
MAILRLTLTSHTAEIKRIGGALSEFLDEEGIPPSLAHRARLVVEELVVNVIRHAFDDAREHAILLDVRTEPGGVAIVVEDDGKAFDPRDVRAPELRALVETGKPGGLGLAMIKKLARDLTYARVDGRNRVRAFVGHSPRGGSS